MKKNDKKRERIYRKILILSIIMALCILISLFNIDIKESNNVTNDIYEENTNITNNFNNVSNTTNDNNNIIDDNKNIINIDNIPPYNGNAYIELNGNIPEFKEEDFTTVAFENYSELDEYKRCGVAFANVCKEIMPKEDEERGSISHKPTGWVQNEYSHLINTKYLYNRCHLIGWQLSNENNNKKNLITGTAYLNQAMIEWENNVAEYINNNKEKNYHVLYRVTPVFEGKNLLANGVQMEAMAVEERQKGICFNIYIYNVQPGIAIDYATGENYEKLLLTE